MGRRIKKTLAVLVLVLIAFAIAGCRPETSEPKGVGETRVVRDDLGNEVKLPLKVTRAVSLAPNLTEIVFAVGAGDRLVGVTTFCNYPKEAASIQKVGDTLKPNIESIVALRPQLVLVSTASQLESFSKVLKEQGIEVYVTNPATLEGVYAGIENLAEIFGETEKAKSMVERLKTRVDAAASKIQSAPKAPSVFVQIDMSLYTIGKNSFISDALSKININSVTNDIDDPFPKISKEHARKLNPDFIIISESPGNESPNDVFEGSSAVRQDRVYKVNADILSRPGPRIVDALEQIADLVNKRGVKR